MELRSQKPQNGQASRHAQATDDDISPSGLLCAGTFSLLTAGALSMLLTDNTRNSIPASVFNHTRETYGTLAEPLFKVDESLHYADFSGYRDFLSTIPKAEATEAYEERVRALKQLADRVDLLIESLKKRKEIISGLATSERSELCESAAPILNMFTEILQSFGELSQPLEELDAPARATLAAGLLRIEQASKAARECENAKCTHIAHQVSPEAFVRNLVELLTHKKLPQDVRIVIGEISRPGVIGLSDFVHQEITVEDVDYVQTVTTMAHEAGHLLAQHYEHFASQSEDARSRNEVRAWEEACAFAFEFVAASYISAHYPEYAERAEQITHASHFSNLYNYHIFGYKTEPHARGMAIFDAAWEELGSCAAAYNYLCSHTELTPAMEAIIERKGEALENSVLSREAKTLFDKVGVVTGALDDKLDAVSELIEQLMSDSTRAQWPADWGLSKPVGF